MNGRRCSNDDLGFQTGRGAYPRQGHFLTLMALVYFQRTKGFSKSDFNFHDASRSEVATAGSAANGANSASTKRRLNWIRAGIVAKRGKSRDVQ